jgi:hypothetical protein
MAEPGYLTACETLEKQRVLLESLAREENASKGLTRAKSFLLHDELERLKEETCKIVAVYAVKQISCGVA